MTRTLFNIRFNVGRRVLTFQAWCADAADARDYFHRRIAADWDAKGTPVLGSVSPA